MSKFEQAPANGAEGRGESPLQVAIARALALLEAGEAAQAAAELESCADLARRDELACYAFGLIHFNASDPREALSWFDRALALKPDHLEALSARALVLQRLGQPEEALDAFDDLARLDPEDADARFSIGVILQSLGRMKEALAAYDDALRLRPGHCEALTNRGALLERFGRLDEALACFEAVLALRPDDAGAFFNKGSTLQKLGRFAEALSAYEAAAGFGPPDPETELNRGNVLQRLGRLEEALACYDRAARRPNGYPQAHFNRGIALQGLGRPAAALVAYDAALALDPRYCEALCNRGNILHELGRLDEAFSAYAEALRIRPAFVPALVNRANICLRWGRLDQALRCCEEALKQDPRHPQAQGLRGEALRRLGRPDEALGALEAAIAVRPEAPDAWLNRGNALQELDRLDEAIASYHEALRLRPDYPEALSSLGVALKERGEVDAALACFDRALESRPHFADARNNRAGALLLKGRLREGFEDFESRWSRSNAPARPIVCAAPQWNGEELAGKSILVHDEQGLGDLIQFCRYLPMLERRGARVDLICRASMRRMLRSLGGGLRFVEATQASGPYDFSCPLMSLPRGFATELGAVPAATPYLVADPEACAAWAKTLGDDGFRIGVCWRGSAAINLKRGFAPEALAPLKAIAGVRLISLMRGDGVDVTGADGSMLVEGLGASYDAGPDAFLDCAAVMAHCDLIVTSDTAVAHLAGALGRPTFLALRQAADWRWLLEREDSPWYPSMRLFRQTVRDDWAPVFARVAQAVAPLVAAKLRPPGDDAAHGGAAIMAAAGGGASVGAASGGGPELVRIPAAVGELIDKITILEIKERRVGEAEKLRNIRYELALLRQLRDARGWRGEEFCALERELRRANEILWDVEDALRACEKGGRFDERFVSLARLVYVSNDRRAALKRRISLLCNSAIVEEKFFADA
ncbi:tetratricopeptide repeat protein [Methylocella sp.]|uniref:tetratricopeptide repeat protein n=1 Tax=Methylocella sp. TaxID=1978226 RepID=UPI003782E05C